jgi:hypothetical protein
MRVESNVVAAGERPRGAVSGVALAAGREYPVKFAADAWIVAVPQRDAEVTFADKHGDVLENFVISQPPLTRRVLTGLTAWAGRRRMMRYGTRRKTY